MKGSQRGIALVTTLLLGVIAVVFVAILLQLVTLQSQTSAAVGKYTSSLELARGIARYIIKQVNADSLTCGGTSCTETNNKVDIVGVVYTGYTVDATFQGRTDGTGFTIYAFTVTATNNATGEKATIDFVVRKNY